LLAPYIGLKLTEEEMSHIRSIGIPWLLVLSLIVIHHLVTIDYRRKLTLRNLHEKREIFTAALEIIKASTRLTIDLISEFRAIFEKNKYFIKSAQEKMLIGLVSDLGDIRINDEELKSDTLSPEERKALVAHRRKLLDRIENMEPTIENYLRKIT